MLEVADIQISDDVAQVMFHYFLNIKGQYLECNTILSVAIDNILNYFLEILNIDLIILSKWC